MFDTSSTPITSDRGDSQNPYVGPRAFRTGEALYGRDREARQLLDLLIAERIVLLYSPSGAGKSSLVSAGLLPRLAAEGFRVLPVMRVNLEPPTALAASEVNRYALSALLSLEEAFPEGERLPLDQLITFSLGRYFTQLSGRQTQAKRDLEVADDQNSIVLIFDQFEEILTIDPADRLGKLAFFTQLGAALRERNRWALFSMREDYTAALEPYLKSVPTRLRTTFRLDFLGDEAARQAIQNPAAEAGIDFTDAAARKLVDDLRRIRIQRADGAIEEQLGPYIEPVQLQVVCYRLWEHLFKDAGQVTPADIEGLGDVDTALADYYAESVEQIARQVEVSERAIREWVGQQLITDQGIRGQVLMGAEASSGLDNHAIKLLVNAHLVRSEKRGGATWFELTHDRLIDPIRRNNAAWLDAHLSLLQRQAALWKAQARPDHLLLRGQALIEAEAWAVAHAREITPTEKSFLAECRELQHREEEALVKAEQDIKLAEQARTAAMLRRRAYALTVALAITLVMTVAAFYLGNLSRVNAQNAQAASTQAVEQQVKAEAASTLAIDYANRAITANTEEASQRAAAQAASTQAVAQRATAQAASTQAVAQQVKAEAASTQAVAQQATAVAERNIAATAQAEAETQGRVALSRELAALSINYQGSQTNLALLLGIEAYRTWNTIQARSALLTGLQATLRRTAVQYGKTIPSPQAAIYSIALSKDSSKLAWGGGGGLIGVWDIDQQKLAWSQVGHAGRTVLTVAFSPDGRLLATGGENGDIQFWNANSGRTIQRFATNYDIIFSLAFSPDGTTLASGGAGSSIALWDVGASKFLRSITTVASESTYTLAWSPDGSQLASAGKNQIVRIWDVAAGKEIQTLTGHEGRILSVAWSPDGKWLASAGEDVRGEKNKFVILWDLASNAGTPLLGHTSEVYSVAFSPDGSSLASGSADRSIVIWNPKSFQALDQFVYNTNQVRSLAFARRSSGETLLAAGSVDRTVSLYEITTQQPLGQVLTTNRYPVMGIDFSSRETETGTNIDEVAVMYARPSGYTISSIEADTGTTAIVRNASGAYSASAFSPDGSRVAFGYDSGLIEISNTQTGQAIQSISTTSGRVWSLAFSPDGNMLASSACLTTDLDFCTENVLYLWQLSDGTLASQLPPANLQIGQESLPQFQTDYILSLAFSPDGRVLASGSKDHTIVLWGIDTQLPLAPALLGHAASVTSLTFTPDGSMLASGDQDGALILWDTALFQPIGTPFSGLTEGIASLAFRQDGQLLASGGSDGRIVLWDTSIDSWLTSACSLAGRNFTSDEWRLFFGDRPYQKTCPQWP